MKDGTIKMLCPFQDNPVMGTLQRESVNSVSGIMAELGH